MNTGSDIKETKNARCMICVSKNLGETPFLTQLTKKMNIDLSDYYVTAVNEEILIEDEEDFYAALLGLSPKDYAEDEMEISLGKR